jgi:hypothetical protein
MSLQDRILRLVSARRRSSNEKERACGSKVRYGSQETADRATSAMLKKTGQTLESYECRFCHKWHIGHSNRITVEIISRSG